MNVYLLIGVLLAWAMYVPMSQMILKSKSEQNLATFILWGILDGEAAVSLMVQHGNWYLPAAYVLGCLVTIACILKAGTFKWTWFETLCSIIVLWCAYEWVVSGPRMAAIISTAGVVIAGLPQFKDAYLVPFKMPLGPYVGFSVANMFSTFGGTAWTVEERLYPAACTVLCVLIVLMVYTRRQIVRAKEMRQALAS